MRTPADILGTAFHDDPFFAHILPDDSRRTRRLPWLMSRFVRLTEQVGTVDAIDGEAVALSMPASAASMPLPDLARAGFLAAPHRIGPPATRRMLRALSASSNAADGLDDDVYFFMLAVHPDAQGRGHGRTLLRRVLERAENEGRGVYLETNKARNVPFYERAGMEVIRHQVMPQGYDEWLLRRAPRVSR